MPGELSSTCDQGSLLWDLGKRCRGASPVDGFWWAEMHNPVAGWVVAVTFV